MALPSDWDLVPIRWWASNLDGTAPSGTLTVTASQDRFYDLTGTGGSAPDLVVANPVNVTIVNGRANFSLPATDDTNISPSTGWVYTCVETLGGGGKGRTYNFTVPIAALSTGIDLGVASITESVSPQPVVPAWGVILHGTGAPSNSLGHDADFYIDGSAGELYGPKASGVWPAGTALTGGGSGGLSITDNGDGSLTIAPGSGSVTVTDNGDGSLSLVA